MFEKFLVRLAASTRRMRDLKDARVSSTRGMSFKQKMQWIRDRDARKP